jgi:RNA polymerase sigma-54 factor
MAPLQDLQALIAQEVELNPTLEVVEPVREQVEIESDRSSDLDDVDEKSFEEEYELLARLDEDNRDSFKRNEVLQRPSTDAEARRQFMLESMTTSPTLQQHLKDQLDLSGLSGLEHQLAEMIIGNLDDDGYLTMSITEMAASVGVSEEVVEEVLGEIQHFDPVGVASRSLQECLMQQLSRAGRRGTLDARIVAEHLSDLARHRYADIARKLDASEEAVREAASHIACLDPKPGRKYAGDQTIYVIPEVFVKKIRGKWRVRTNDRELPRIRIHPEYRKMMEDPATDKEARRYLRDKIRNGGFLQKSLGQRQDTLRRIAKEIVQVQEPFFEKGVKHLKPLTMSEIAEALGIHETTVSRAVSNKYMQTPDGTYELKYFFTPGYTGQDGNAVSNKTIKDAIRDLVDQEDPAKPLSDQAMVNALKAQGFQVARRTIAKYRDELHILPSHLRKA